MVNLILKEKKFFCKIKIAIRYGNLKMCENPMITVHLFSYRYLENCLILSRYLLIFDGRRQPRLPFQIR